MQRVVWQRTGAVAALTAGLLAFGTVPAWAHGGSVDPPAEQQDCRDLALYAKGEGSNAKGGLTTAGDNGRAVEWGHCS